MPFYVIEYLFIYSLFDCFYFCRIYYPCQGNNNIKILAIFIIAKKKGWKIYRVEYIIIIFFVTLRYSNSTLWRCCNFIDKTPGDCQDVPRRSDNLLFTSWGQGITLLIIRNNCSMYNNHLVFIHNLQMDLKTSLFYIQHI